MQKLCTEDWKFELTVINGKSGHCRLGMETIDKFIFSYECPAGMCPNTMAHKYIHGAKLSDAVAILHIGV